MSNTAVKFIKDFGLYNEKDVATFNDEQAKRLCEAGVAEVFKENVEIEGSQTPGFTDEGKTDSKKSSKKKADPDADVLG